MRELIKNNLGVRSFCCYILVSATAVAIGIFFIQCFDQIVSYEFTKIPYFLLDMFMITFKAAILVALITLFCSYILRSNQKENAKSGIIKWQPFFSILFAFVFLLFIHFMLSADTPLIIHSYAVAIGFSVVIVCVLLLYGNKAYYDNFKKVSFYLDKDESSKLINESYLGKNLISNNNNRQNIRQAVDPNEELIKRVEELMKFTEEQEVEPIGNVNLNIVIYVYGEGFDYCLLDSGLDIPFLFGDEKPEAVLEECHFLHINLALYIRVDQVYIFDFDENYVILNPAVDRNLSNIRSRRVKEKLNSYRVIGKPSGYFHIHPDLSIELRALLDKYMNKRFEN